MGASPTLLLVTSTVPNLQCFFVDSNMYLSPDAAFGAAMLAGVPLAFTFGLDTCAVDKEVQWTFGASI